LSCFDHAGNKTGKFLQNSLLPYAVIGKCGACNAIGSTGTSWLFHNGTLFNGTYYHVAHLSITTRKTCYLETERRNLKRYSLCKR